MESLSSLKRYVPSKRTIQSWASTMGMYAEKMYRWASPRVHELYLWSAHKGYTNDQWSDLEDLLESMYSEWAPVYHILENTIVGFDAVTNGFLFVLGLEDFDVFGLDLAYNPRSFFLAMRSCSWYPKYKLVIDFYAVEYNWDNT